ncbi:MAG: hypothetical protein LBK73_04210 [Treponema sp.]|jgi:hypothetical protein|nr:hypothetical protein [Treponema sp.]
MMDKKLFFVKKGKGASPLLALLIAAAVAFVSCDDFFGTSWGAPRDYDPSNIDVSAGNVDQWIAESAGNPDLAEALMKKIKADLDKSGLSSADRLALQNAGMRLAIEASGLGTSLVSNATSVLGDLSDFENLDAEKIEETVKNLFTDIQSDFRVRGPAAAANLAEIAGHSLKDGTGGTPEFSQDFAGAAKPADVGMAVVTLAMAVIEDTTGDVSDVDLRNLSASDIPISVNADGKFIVTDDHAAPEIVVLGAYLNLIASGGGEFKDNPITGPIGDAFGLAK